MHAEFKRYLFEYRHGGSEWALEVVATSPQDAQERLILVKVLWKAWSLRRDKQSQWKKFVWST
jgi:hypothetical protein